MINTKKKEIIYFRAVRPSLTGPKDYFRKCSRGICKIDGVYFTTSLIEALIEWAREDFENGWWKGKVIIYRPPENAIVYRPNIDYREAKRDYKKYKNTRIITDDEHLHEGCIKGEINYSYKLGCDKDSFRINIYRDIKGRINVDVKAEFVENDGVYVKQKLAYLVSKKFSNSKFFYDLYTEVAKKDSPKLKTCETVLRNNIMNEL